MKETDFENKNPFIPWYADEYVEPVRSDSSEKSYFFMKPQDIKAELEKNVVNQEEACRKIAVMVYHHLHGHRFVGLLAGPTGSGKSFIAENLQRVFPDIVYIRDVSNVTCDGWKGNKKVSSLFAGIRTSGLYHGRRIHPIVFLDECDKMFAPKIASGGENVSESVQGEFLTAIQGSELTYIAKGEGIGGIDERIVVETGKISFLFAGAFAKRAEAIAQNESGPKIGFGASGTLARAYDRELTMDDVIDAGCIRELGGRIQTMVNLNRLGEDEYRRMLDYTDRGPVCEMEEEYGIRIYISGSKKDEIAHEAYEKGLGVRGMKNAIQEYINELTWNDCDAKKLDIE